MAYVKAVCLALASVVVAATAAPAADKIASLPGWDGPLPSTM